MTPFKFLYAGVRTLYARVRNSFDLPGDLAQTQSSSILQTYESSLLRGKSDVWNLATSADGLNVRAL